jgi:hypothetical protein
MTGLSFAVRPHDGKQTPIGAVIGAMTAPLVKQYETLVPEESLQFCEADPSRIPLHLGEKLLAMGHQSSGAYASVVNSARLSVAVSVDSRSWRRDR